MQRKASTGSLERKSSESNLMSRRGSSSSLSSATSDRANLMKRRASTSSLGSAASGTPIPWQDFMGPNNPPTSPKDLKKWLQSIEIREMDARVPGDTHDCNIRGVTCLPKDRAVLVDHGNKNVKLIDISSNSCISKLSLSSPWSATMISEDEIAVTEPGEQKIRVLSIKEMMKVRKTIATPRKCYGIIYNEDRGEFFVTLLDQPPAIQILTLDGDVKATITEDRSKGRLLRSPNYIAYNSRRDMLYVSDYDIGVLGMDRNGAVKFLYQGIKKCFGIATDHKGDIFVCGCMPSEIHQLAPNGTRTKIFSNDNLARPLCLAYDQNNGSFIVTFHPVYGKGNKFVNYTGNTDSRTDREWSV